MKINENRKSLHIAALIFIDFQYQSIDYYWFILITIDYIDYWFSLIGIVGSSFMPPHDNVESWGGINLHFGLVIFGHA